MLRHAAAPVGLLLVGIVVLIAGGGSTSTEAVAFALIGIACVVALSLVFLAVGRSEDAQRAADAAAREPDHEPPADPHAPTPHDEARRRRRPMPPRRPN